MKITSADQKVDWSQQIQGDVEFAANLIGADFSEAYGTPVSGTIDGWKSVDGFWTKGRS